MTCLLTHCGRHFFCETVTLDVSLYQSTIRIVLNNPSIIGSWEKWDLIGVTGLDNNTNNQPITP